MGVLYPPCGVLGGCAKGAGSSEEGFEARVIARAIREAGRGDVGVVGEVRRRAVIRL